MATVSVVQYYSSGTSSYRWSWLLKLWVGQLHLNHVVGDQLLEARDFMTWIVEPMLSIRRIVYVCLDYADRFLCQIIAMIGKCVLYPPGLGLLAAWD